ncbi:MAG: transcriptional regulator [Saprospiraceae bacterium]|jgi:DNA-binding SARP family transcriptional activator|nr:transcriptional regulator [Saprospiraceae bacterium]
MQKKNNAAVVIYTFGNFEVYSDSKKIPQKSWKRDKSLQLLQFMIFSCHQKALHKEQIIDRLWEDDMDDQGFKVALHGISKVLEPSKKSHAESRFIERNGHTYRLNTSELWVDSFSFESLIYMGNRYVHTNPTIAEQALREALLLHTGTFLPDRIFEDWSADERERLQLMFLNASVTLAELLLEKNPAESIQLCQNALLEDLTWEDAYRIQMAAFYARGNRPMAIKTYQVCEKVLWEEMALKPLPETRKLYEKIRSAE